jgi:Xaa-Pro aminopeptidase
MRTDFTRVCRSNLHLANARFLSGCTGKNLDILARAPFWEHGLDYKHGTGHGVGYLLNVHEGPNSFRWKQQDSGKEAALEEGMVTTDEPGLYLEGRYGIRLENELLCIRDEKNEYGQFMSFENLTYVPFDLDALDPGQLTEQERTYLNDYHARVYEKVSPHLTEAERAWLREATREI